MNRTPFLFVSFLMVCCLLLASCELAIFQRNKRYAENTYGFLRIIPQCG